MLRGYDASMILLLDVTEFHEDDPLQAEIIRNLCPECQVVEHVAW